MYKVVKTDKEAVWHGGVSPLVTLADEWGGRAQIVSDDGCLVLLLKHNTYDPENPIIYRPAIHWFKEAVEAVRSMDI